MSFDLEVRPEDSGSPSTDRSQLVALLVAMGAREVAPTAFIVSAPEGSVEVDLDLVTGDPTRVSVIGVGGSAPQQAARVAFELADVASWRVYDLQSGNYITPSDLGPGLPWRVVLLQVRECCRGASPWWVLRRFLGHIRRQSAMSLFGYGIGFWLISEATNRFISRGTPFWARPGVLVALCFCSAALVVDALLDVFGDLAQRGGVSRAGARSQAP